MQDPDVDPSTGLIDYGDDKAQSWIAISLNDASHNIQKESTLHLVLR